MTIPQKGDVIEVTVTRVKVIHGRAYVNVAHEGAVNSVMFWWKHQQPSIPLPFMDDPDPEEALA